MNFETLIDVHTLHEHRTDPSLVIFDCRFSLKQTEQGRENWQQAHIPGAIYAHLDDDLSGAIVKGKTGRHPLPEITDFAARLGAWGVGPNSRVVVYDDMGGAIAARMWWMVRWLGHDAVAVLDGGWKAWLQAGYPTDDKVRQRDAQIFTARPRREALVDMQEVSTKRGNPDYVLLDARGEDRYRGENETIDPIAGHIPGAISLPFAGNLDQSGHFKDPARLAARFAPLQEEASSRHTIIYCGSGVTAAHNILAMRHAGLGDALLYPGSWSEWITNPNNPIATGESVFGNE